MTIYHPSQRPLRLWPGVAAVVLQWLLFIGLPLVAKDLAIFGMLGGVAFGLIVLVWWLFFSRAPWLERLGAIVIMIGAVAATRFFVDPSIAGAGMGRMLPILSLMPLSLGLVAALVMGRNLSTPARRGLMVVAILIACGSFTLIRTGGVSGGGVSDFHWRWTPTPEERLLAQAANEPTVPVTAPPAPAPAPSIPGMDSGKPLPESSSTRKSADPAAKTTAAATTHTETAGSRGVARLSRSRTR